MPVALPVAHPALIAPKQKRSREMAERVLAATMRLLRRSDFQALAMADIAREAGVSVGAIYTRFPTKERLLCFLADRALFAEPDGAAVRIMQPLQRAVSLRNFLGGYLRAIADIFTRHRAIVAPMSVLARESRDNELRAYLTKVNETAQARLRQAMLRYADEIARPDPAAAVDFAIVWMGAAMREAMLFAEPAPRSRRLDGDAFVNELADAIALYLTSNKRAKR
jgi:AcrR family transcriptional regulator